MTREQKKLIPNILTIARIILTIVIIILGLTGHINLVIIFTILAALTDFFDGFLARKWKVTSLVGAKLDAVADKFFAIGLIACLTNKLSILYLPLIIEIILCISNLYFHFKSGKTKSLPIGKIKTWVLFISIIFAILSIITKTNILSSLTNGLVYITVNLQVLSLISYSLYYKNNMENLSIENNEAHKKIMNETEDTIKIDNLEELIDDVISSPKHEKKAEESEIDNIMDKYIDDDINDIL